MAAYPTSTSNPFSTRFVRPGALPYLFPEGTSTHSLIDRLAENGWWGQIVGPHGTGKSTLLHSLSKDVVALRRVVSITLQARRLRMPLERLVWEALDDQSLLVVDGYEQLSGLQRMRLQHRCRRRRCGLLVSAHVDMHLPTVYETQTSNQSVQRLVARLLAKADFQIDAADVSDAIDRCGGNVREAFFQLYDLYQSQRLNQSQQ